MNILVRDSPVFNDESEVILNGNYRFTDFLLLYYVICIEESLSLISNTCFKRLIKILITNKYLKFGNNFKRIFKDIEHFFYMINEQ